MLRNYLKIAYRNFVRNKTFTIINLLGLVLGMAACLLLANYITFETSFDQFYEDSENIYRVTHEFYQEGELQSQSAAVYSPLATALQHQLSEALSVTRIHPISGTINSGEGNSLLTFSEEHIYFVDSSFLDVFPLKIIGGIIYPLNHPNTAVITSEIAKKYFANNDPVGSTIHWNDGSNQATFTISAVVEDVPENSHLDFNFLFTFSTLERIEANSLVPLEENWGWPGFYTYLHIIPSQDIDALETKINAIVDRQVGETLRTWNNSALKFHLQPLTDIHLHSGFQDELSANGDGATVTFISIIAGIILLIAYINYINLSTVKSLERAREVGIRKVMGSHRWQLVSQFLVESFLINAFALLLSFLLYHAALPFAPYFITSSLADVLWDSPYIILILLFLLFLGPLFTSLYPALVLSNYKPIVVLKGRFRHSSQGALLRKSLVVLQYTVSVAMIAGTLVVFEQIQYMRDKDLGVNVDQMLIVRGPTLDAVEDNKKSRTEAFKEALRQQPVVTNVSVSSAIPGTEVRNVMMHKLPSNSWDNGHTIATLKADADFIATYQAEIVAGRNFSVENQQDTQGKTVLVNEAAALLLGFQNPKEALQQTIVPAVGEGREVIGIVRNHHQHSVAQDYEPLLFVIDPSENQYVSIKVNSTLLSGYSDFQQLIRTVETTYNKYYPGNAFDYFFLNDFFNQQYQSEVKFSRLFTFFASLAIIVACLGLFGLASYTAMQRTQEIGVRKILGASLGSIFWLLSQEYLKLIVIALAVAIPIANYFAMDWLDNFSFRVTLEWWLLALPGLLILVTALLSITGQTLRVATRNPVDSLRDE